MSTTRLASVVLAILLLYVFWGWFASLILQVNRHPLWIDEFVAMDFLSAPAKALMDRLSGSSVPHFPAYFLLAKPWFDFALRLGLNTNWVARIGTIAVSAILIILSCLAIMRSRHRVPSAAVFVVGLWLLSGDSPFRQHVLEMRMYGLSSIAMVALLALIIAESRLAVILISAFLISLFPVPAVIGIPVGLTATVVQLLRVRSQLRRGEHSRQDVLHAVLSLLAILLLLATILWVGSLVKTKFLDASAHGISLKGEAGSAGASLVGHIDSKAIWRGLAVLGVTVGVLLFQTSRKSTATLQSLEPLAMLLVLQLSVTVFRIALPSLPISLAYPRYVEWLNPGLKLVSVAGAVLLIDMLLRLVHVGASRYYQVALVVALIPLAVMCHSSWRKASLGPPWGDGLDEAGRFISMNAISEAGIASNNAEMFSLPQSLRAGLKCGRATQITAYLDPSTRAQVVCEKKGVISAAGFKEFWYVSEPIAWVGGRKFHPEPLTLAKTFQFGKTGVDLYTLDPGGRSLPVSQVMEVPEQEEGTLIAMIRVPGAKDMGRLPTTYLLLCNVGAAPDIKGQGFALFHSRKWVEGSAPTLAIAVSHDGETGRYGVKGRWEQYLSLAPAVRVCGGEAIVMLGVAWRRSTDAQIFAVTFDPTRNRGWIDLPFLFQELGGATSVSLPVGEVTSDYQIAGAVFFDQYYRDLEAWQLRANVERLLALCAE